MRPSTTCLMNRVPGFVLLCLLAIVSASADVTRDDPKALPAHVDLRPDFQKFDLPVRMQGPRGTCSVFATAGAIEFAASKKLGQGFRASEEFLNWAADRATNRPNQDGHFFSELEAGFRAYGACKAKEMPYAAEFSNEYEPSERALKTAASIRDLGLAFEWIRKNDGKSGVSEEQFEAIRAALAAGWPVAAGSYHSVLFVGYEDAPGEEGGGHFLARNSAGGADTMSYGEARGRLCDAFCVRAPGN